MPFAVILQALYVAPKHQNLDISSKDHNLALVLVASKVTANSHVRRSNRPADVGIGSSRGKQLRRRRCTQSLKFVPQSLMASTAFIMMLFNVPQKSMKWAKRWILSIWGGHTHKEWPALMVLTRKYTKHHELTLVLEWDQSHRLVHGHSCEMQRICRLEMD